MALYLVVLAMVVVLTIALVFLLRKLVDWVSFPCPFCDVKVTTFHQLSPEDQENILTYFREHERREPYKRALFVCLHCRTVHDDLSGAKQARERDIFAYVTFCKVCNAFMYHCYPDNDNIKCTHCGTPYKWNEHKRSGFRFFMPPVGTKLQERSIDEADSFTTADGADMDSIHHRGGIS